MPEQSYISVGLLAHVDAGKTTLSEALLYHAGARRTLGQVDHGDSLLDSHELERARGITIFSKNAILDTPHCRITLLDTPGHVDFSPEAERVLSVLDCAVLVISGTDGVQAHTLTLWHLLEKYGVPVILFINKMDLPGADPQRCLAQLREKLSPECVDFTGQIDGEAVAMCSDDALEEYLSGEIQEDTIRALIARRRLFPCCFGSALRLTETQRLLDILDRYVTAPAPDEQFGAAVYKISHDSQKNRLTWLRVTGGVLHVRDALTYQGQDGRTYQEKIQQIRLYSGEKFSAAEQALPGQICAATGLSASFSGLGLGSRKNAEKAVLEPVMTFRVDLPAGMDAASAMSMLRLLEEEDPSLHLVCQGSTIHVQLMGAVQGEVFRALVRERFAMDVTLSAGQIVYKETIAAPVEGVGHYEPLRHYAEVHILLEPAPRGSGLHFATNCSLDVLDGNYQQLILTHMSEKPHLGVLTGSPITDMTLTLLVGKAHLKHTEGGDFRQATYRAIRQGLMHAQSILLEPVYHFIIWAPAEQIGRAITDVRAMGGEFESPETRGDLSVLQGTVPASQVGDYAQQLAAYTQGRGQLQLTPAGYAPCHNTQAVIEARAYDPEGDLENSPDSVFCSHGAGFVVKWRDVPQYMHLESPLKKEKPQVITRNLRLDDRELEAIMQREFGAVKRPLYRPAALSAKEDGVSIQPPREKYLIVDGYNIIYAWKSLASVADNDLDKARQALISRLMNYNAFRGQTIILVFDGYKVKGNPGERFLEHNVHVVYTRENQTADAYIEAFVAGIGKNYAVRVATSDALVQLSSLRSGVLRMSARELELEISLAEDEMKSHYQA